MGISKNKSRKLSGVILTGALVAPAAMNAAQQNVVSADLGDLLSPAKEWGTWALGGIEKFGRAFLNTWAGRITAVVAAAGLLYGLFSLGKMGFEYVRNKSLGNKGSAKTNIIDQNNGSEALTDKAGYKKFIEKLREASGENGSLFNLTTKVDKDDITINLKKGKRSLEIKATFEENKFEEIGFVYKDNEPIYFDDDFANKLAENLNNFFENAEIPVLAKTGVGSNEVADVDKISFQSTDTKNKKYSNNIDSIKNDDKENTEEDYTKVDYNAYGNFIKRLDEAIEDTGITKAEETKNNDEIITTLTKQGKVLKIKAIFKNKKLQKVEVARESKDKQEIYTENNAKDLLTTINTFFKDAGVLIEASYKEGMKTPNSVDDICFEKTVSEPVHELTGEDCEKFIKNIQEAAKSVENLEFEFENKGNNVTEIVLTGKAGNKSSLQIEVTSSWLDAGIVAKSSLESSDIIPFKLSSEKLVGKLNTFFSENNIVLSARIDKNKKGFGDIAFEKGDQAVKKEIKKEDIKKAIEESTTKGKIEEYVENLIENKVKNKNKNKNIKTENIKIEVKGEDIQAIKEKIKVEDYLKSNDIKQDIEKAVKKAVEDEYDKKVDEEIGKYNLVKQGLKNVMVQKLYTGDPVRYTFTLPEAERLLNKIYKNLNLDNLKFKNEDTKEDIKKAEEHIQKAIKNNKEVSKEINIELNHCNIYCDVRRFTEMIDFGFKTMDEEEIKKNTDFKDLNSVRRVINITIKPSNDKDKKYDKDTAQMINKILCINYDEKEKKYKLTTNYNSKNGLVTKTFDKIDDWKKLFFGEKK